MVFVPELSHTEEILFSHSYLSFFGVSANIFFMDTGLNNYINFNNYRNLNYFPFISFVVFKEVASKKCLGQYFILKMLITQSWKHFT